MKISASKGTVFSFSDHKPQTRIYIENLPADWSSGFVYLTIEGAKELYEELGKSLKKGNVVIFGTPHAE